MSSECSPSCDTVHEPRLVVVWHRVQAFSFQIKQTAEACSADVESLNRLVQMVLANGDGMQARSRVDLDSIAYSTLLGFYVLFYRFVLNPGDLRETPARECQRRGLGGPPRGPRTHPGPGQTT